MKRFLSAVLVGLLLSTGALARDVFPQDKIKDPYYIKVTKTVNAGEEYVTFERCLHNNSVCDVLGPAQMYSMRSLQKQQSKETREFLGSILGNALTLWASFSLPAIVTGAIVGDSMGGGIITFLVGVAGASVGEGIALVTGALNPIKQAKQRLLIKDAVIEDEDVTTGSDIYKLSRRLENILDRI